MTNDAVVSVHTDPLTCGVAKWNAALAAKLGVPLVPLAEADNYRRPLISVKPSELGAEALSVHLPFDLFLHGSPRPQDGPCVKWATRIYAGNPVIARAIKTIRSDVQTLGCPSTIERKDQHFFSILTFGMAHKLQYPLFEKVRDLLGDKSYTLQVSTGIHEGTPWTDTFRDMQAAMTRIFGDKLRMLGFLGDDALIDQMHNSAYVLLPYEPAARANNTTLWAAAEAGITIITTLDEDSPASLLHGYNCWDLHKLTVWPQPLFSSPDPLTWEAVLGPLRG